MKKPQLIILSDIHGKVNDEWTQYYLDALSIYFTINYLDCVSLAEIGPENQSKEEIHGLFVEGGIDQAVSNLMKLKGKNAFILAFSIGGTIAWKAALNGLPVHKVVAVSSTRLRKEYQKPKCEIELYFGEKDLNRPKDEWFEEMELQPTILHNQKHKMYTEKNIADKVIADLIESIQEKM